MENSECKNIKLSNLIKTQILLNISPIIPLTNLQAHLRVFMQKKENKIKKIFRDQDLICKQPIIFRKELKYISRNAFKMKKMKFLALVPMDQQESHFHQLLFTSRKIKKLSEILSIQEIQDVIKF